MTKYLIIVYFLIGLVSAPLVYGMEFAYWQGKFPSIAKSSILKVFSAIFAAFNIFLWPVLLPFTFLATRLAHYGLRFK